MSRPSQPAEPGPPEDIVKLIVVKFAAAAVWRVWKKALRCKGVVAMLIGLLPNRNVVKEDGRHDAAGLRGRKEGGREGRKESRQQETKK